ncbi:hypothetical protein GUJ93_ZPchr0012g19863 [Zizania palustris]|uniref:PGG domain-containing protein n=1 Tax=Zizania palustris TaxID=103762 RepID=A0A8J6BSV1_ZIZPA|nr:hypothetical protein GUJ93_ZPchr0012g19863 [Zizania palustris]
MSSTNKVVSSNNRNRAAKDKSKSDSNNPTCSSEYQLKKYLLLLATLVVTVTYAAGLNLPGGSRQEDTQDGDAGDPILPGTHHVRYVMFYYCNATAFAASLVVCLLLLVLDEESSRCAAVLRLVMVLDLLGLMGAYAAGSCIDTFTTIYSAVIMSVVLAYIVPSLFSYAVSKLHGKDPEQQIEDSQKKDEYPAEHKSEEQLHEVLMLLATFAITITFVAGLNPPGGFWHDDQKKEKQSYPVLWDISPRRYQAFFVCNTTAFVASLLIIMLVLDKKVKMRRSLQFAALYGSIVVALFGLVGAYAAGSCRDTDNTIYVICLIAAVLAYIFLQVAISKAMNTSPEEDSHTGEKPCRTTSGKLAKQDLDDSSRRERKHNDAMEKARSLVMLLATLAASITYQAGLDPPGGVLTDDKHKGGSAVLLTTTHSARYKVFFYSNSIAFVTSLVAIVMVQSSAVLKGHTLEAAMILDLFALVCAYAAGSCRDVDTSVYVVALAGGVLVYVVIHITFFTLDHIDNHLQDDPVEEKRREVLLLLAILAATLTYQAGLTPPGGFWSEDDNDPNHKPGFPVLLDKHPGRYNAFFYCNAASFMASMALILLLVNPNLYRPGIRCYALYVCMVAGMFGLMCAYTAGSSRQLRTSIYVLTLVGAVFALITLQVAMFWCKVSSKKGGSNAAKRSSSQASTAMGVSFNEASADPAGTRDRDDGYTGQVADITNAAPSAPRDTRTDSMLRETEAHHDTGKGSRDKDMPEYLMLIGILAASVTYQAGLKPPGGQWEKGEKVGQSILHDLNKRRQHDGVEDVQECYCFGHPCAGLHCRLYSSIILPSERPTCQKQ